MALKSPANFCFPRFQGKGTVIEPLHAHDSGDLRTSERYYSENRPEKLPNQDVVDVVAADPEPDIFGRVFEGQRPIARRDTHRPDFPAFASSDFPEL